MVPSNLHLPRQPFWAPALAVVMSLLMVAGPIFICCKLNESLAAFLTPQEESAPQVSEHAHCHGHANVATDLPWLPGAGDMDTHVQAEDVCLSDAGSPSQALLSSGLSLVFHRGEPSPIPDLAQVRLDCLEKPRPQNQGGPPVYLRTLRLLV